jgi:transposase-like protein
MTKPRYSSELKAQVLAALLAGQSVSEVSKHFNLDKRLTSQWKKDVEQLRQLAKKKEKTSMSCEVRRVKVQFCR